MGIASRECPVSFLACSSFNAMKVFVAVLALCAVVVAAAPSDTITFKDGGAVDAAVSGSEVSSEFDAQIEEVKRDIKRLKEGIKESEAAARRLREQKAQLRALFDKMQHLEKEKEKKILESKLNKQMKDLEEINRMSRALRTKFNELKRTQGLIKTKIT